MRTIHTTTIDRRRYYSLCLTFPYPAGRRAPCNQNQSVAEESGARHRNAVIMTSQQLGAGILAAYTWAVWPSAVPLPLPRARARPPWPPGEALRY